MRSVSAWRATTCIIVVDGLTERHVGSVSWRVGWSIGVPPFVAARKVGSVSSVSHNKVRPDSSQDIRSRLSIASRCYGRCSYAPFVLQFCSCLWPVVYPARTVRSPLSITCCLALLEFRALRGSKVYVVCLPSRRHV